MYDYYSTIKRNPAICDNMGRTWKQYAKWNKKFRERQTFYELTYIMWNLKQKKSSLETENRLVVARGGSWGWAKWMGEGGQKVWKKKDLGIFW